MYRNLTTRGTFIAKEGERRSSSLDSIISALSARTRHVALRADTTLSGSKLALSTSTFLITYALGLSNIIAGLAGAFRHTI
jgi:hypothetical protein